MSELSAQVLEDAATAYDELLASAVFQEWTHRVTDAADIRSGQRVLDVACGTGVLARTVASTGWAERHGHRPGHQPGHAGGGRAERASDPVAPGCGGLATF